MDFRYKKDYLKRFDRFPQQEKGLIILADKQIRDYYTTHSAPYGLRIKKLFQEANAGIFEARVSDKIRILWVESENLAVFTILGSHDEIRNYIKRLR